MLEPPLAAGAVSAIAAGVYEEMLLRFRSGFALRVGEGAVMVWVRLGGRISEVKW